MIDKNFQKINIVNEEASFLLKGSDQKLEIDDREEWDGDILVFNQAEI